jgi:ketosteroid isomerase-like protein
LLKEEITMIFLNRFFILVFVLLLSACETSDQVVGSLSSIDVERIAELREAFVQAEIAGDWAMEAALFAEDGVLIAPNTPILQGRAEIQTRLEDLPPLKNLILTSVKNDGRNGLAYDRGIYSLEYEDVMSGEIRKDTGHYLMVLVKHSEDSWLITALAHNSDQ